VVTVARQESYRSPRGRRRVADPPAADGPPDTDRQRELRAAAARVAEKCERLLRLLADVPAQPPAGPAGQVGSAGRLARLLELLDGAVADTPVAAGLKAGRR
jgi:hypothetical protein